MEVNFGISTIQRNKMRGISAYTFPPHIGIIINRFMYIFHSIEQVDKSIECINKVIENGNGGNLGDNDYSVEVSREFVIFDLNWDKSDDPYLKYYPLKIKTIEFIGFLLSLKDFINKYESCQIPGIIPASKLDSWVAVPKEYVKEEWWTQQQSKEDSK